LTLRGECKCGFFTDLLNEELEKIMNNKNEDVYSKVELMLTEMVNSLSSGVYHWDTYQRYLGVIQGFNLALDVIGEDEI